MRDPATLHGIETKALARLVSKGLKTDLGVKEFDLGYYPTNVQNFAVNLCVYDGKTYSASMNKIRQDVNLRVILALRHEGPSGDESAKRKKSLPVLEAIIKILMLQDLGLQIQPITVEGFKYKTAPEASQNGFIVWEINLSTHYFIDRIDDDEESEVDLELLFVEYFLQKPEDDGTKDASDEIDTKE